MNIPGPPAVLNPEVIHLAKLVKIELDELHRNIRWLTKRLDKPPSTSRADSEIPERGSYQDLLADFIEWRKKTSGVDEVPSTDCRVAMQFMYQELGSSVPPGSDSALREELASTLYDLLMLAQNHGILAPRESAGSLWLKSELLIEKVRAARLPAGGPPTPDLVAIPDSNTDLEALTNLNLNPKDREFMDRARDSLKTQRIGVHDYASLVSALRSNFKQVFGDDEPLTDPQDMIQRMTAEVFRLRSEIMQGFGREVRSSAAEDMLEALKEVSAWFEEWSVEIGAAEETLLARVNAAIMRAESAVHKRTSDPNPASGLDSNKKD